MINPEKLNIEKKTLFLYISKTDSPKTDFSKTISHDTHIISDAEVYDPVVADIMEEIAVKAKEKMNCHQLCKTENVLLLDTVIVLSKID